MREEEDESRDAIRELPLQLGESYPGSIQPSASAPLVVPAAVDFSLIPSLHSSSIPYPAFAFLPRLRRHLAFAGNPCDSPWTLLPVRPKAEAYRNREDSRAEFGGHTSRQRSAVQQQLQLATFPARQAPAFTRKEGKHTEGLKAHAKPRHQCGKVKRMSRQRHHKNTCPSMAAPTWKLRPHSFRDAPTRCTTWTDHDVLDKRRKLPSPGTRSLQQADLMK